MPVKRKMMGSLKRQYGAKKGAAVYYALEQKRKGARRKK